MSMSVSGEKGVVIKISVVENPVIQGVHFKEEF